MADNLTHLWAKLHAVTARRKWLIGAGVVSTALLAAVIEVARFGGMFVSVDDVVPGRCAAIGLAGSSEDIQIDRDRGLAYLSFLEEVQPGEPRKGTVLLLDLNLAVPTPRAALAYDPKDFHPHGLSLLRRESQPLRLFAISHRSNGAHTVEILEDRGGQLFPDDTIANVAFTHPNAIAAVGPRQFYLANDTAAGGDGERLREFLLRRGSGTVWFYDGEEARRVADGLAFPAGLALSPDTSHVYVGEALRKTLRIYRRDPITGALEAEEAIALGAAPDNIDVDADGVVWIAAHPKLLAFAGHLRDATKRAPTRVLRFDPRSGKPKEGETDTRLSRVYENAGAEISAGSVAAHWRGEMLVGAVLDPKVLMCKPVP